jgi:hypothetical protein
MPSSPWRKMRNPAEDAVPGERGVFAVLLEPPIVEGSRHFAHLSWQGESYVLRDYLNGVSRKQGEDLSLTSLWRSARERIPCKGRLRRSVEDHAFWEAELRRLTDGSGLSPGSAVAPAVSVGEQARPKSPRPIGLAKGTFTIPPAFFASLPDDLVDEFQGEKS